MALRRYVDREFLALLRASRGWGEAAVRLGQVRLGANRVGIELRCDDIAPQSLWLAFEVHSGWLLCDVSQAGWLEHLGGRQREVLRCALVGLYKTAGAELVREQIESNFPPPSPLYDLRGTRLMVWPEPTFQEYAAYDLNQSTRLVPELGSCGGWRNWPTLERANVVFAETSISWSDWTAYWQSDQSPAAGPLPLAPSARVLEVLRSRAGTGTLKDCRHCT
jgi:hypothetical protein